MSTFDLVHGLLYVINVVCFIIVLIRMFQNGMIILGIVSLCFWPVALVYGWIKAGDWSLRQVMIIWTIALLLAAVAFPIHPPTYVYVQH